MDKYKYKHPKRVKQVINSPRGPDKRYVQKWGHYRTAPVICKLIETHGFKSFVEVGCCGAQLCEIVLIEFPDIKVTAVDITFSPNPNRAGQLTLAPVDRLRKEYGDRFNWIEAKSVDAAKRFSDRSIDLVYVDAEHSYKAVLADIRAFLPKINARGIMSGHDYGHAQNPGVQRAVIELFGKGRVRVGDYFNWWIPKRMTNIK